MGENVQNKTRASELERSGQALAWMAGRRSSRGQGVLTGLPRSARPSFWGETGQVHLRPRMALGKDAVFRPVNVGRECYGTRPLGMCVFKADGRKQNGVDGCVA